MSCGIAHDVGSFVDVMIRHDSCVLQVAIDLDEALLATAQARAIAHGVSHLIEFRREDFQQVSLVV